MQRFESTCTARRPNRLFLRHTLSFSSPTLGCLGFLSCTPPLTLSCTRPLEADDLEAAHLFCLLATGGGERLRTLSTARHQEHPEAPASRLGNCLEVLEVQPLNGRSSGLELIWRGCTLEGQRGAVALCRGCSVQDSFECLALWLSERQAEAVTCGLWPATHNQTPYCL
jgi:hypothetical protein